MKIYVVTQGSYSDYHIVGVALDEDKAKVIQELASKGLWHESANIEVYESDVFADATKDTKAYTVITDGKLNLLNIYCEGFDSFNDWDKVRFRSRNGGIEFYTDVLAEDEEHAKKIGIDRIAKELARRHML